jgi:hypothetical protein
LSTAPDRATPHTAEKPMPLTSITSIIIAGQRPRPSSPGAHNPPSSGAPPRPSKHRHTPGTPLIY